MDLFEVKIKPMLAFPSKPFDDKNYIFEIKFDGTRGIAYVDVENRKLRLLNRRMLYFEYRYPELNELLNCVKAKRVILDGEVVVLEGGKPNFYKLAEREHVEDKNRIELLSMTMPACYVVFDILYKDGRDLTQLPLLERKRILEDTVKEGKHVLLSRWVREKGKEFFERCKELGLEGIVAKHVNSPYLVGKRSEYWLKIKSLNTLDCVIGGYTIGEGKRAPYFGALLLGVYEGKKLKYVGRVGTGWSEQDLAELKRELEKLVIEKNPFDVFEESEQIMKKVRFVRPKLVCEVKFLELTSDGKLRAPSFVRLRKDKLPEECILSEIKK